jgi:hypothetical protein
MNTDPAALGGDAAGAADRFAAHRNDGRASTAEHFGECPTLADCATHTCTGAEILIHNATRPPSGPANPETP